MDLHLIVRHPAGSPRRRTFWYNFCTSHIWKRTTQAHPKSSLTSMSKNKRTCPVFPDSHRHKYIISQCSATTSKRHRRTRYSNRPPRAINALIRQRGAAATGRNGFPLYTASGRGQNENVEPAMSERSYLLGLFTREVTTTGQEGKNRDLSTTSRWPVVPFFRPESNIAGRVCAR